MSSNNLLIISSCFPDEKNTYLGCIFVQEQVKYLKDFFDNIYVISPVAYGIERVRKVSLVDYQYDNVRIYFPKYLNLPFLYHRGKSFWVSLEAKAVRSLIEREGLDFDIIHAHFTWPSGAVAAEMKKRFGVPLVITEHTSDTIYNAAKTRDECWRRALNAADAIIRVREGDIHLFREFDVPPQKVIAIPNGFDHRTFFPMSKTDCREQLGLPHNRKILLNVGNLYSPVKGHRIFVTAMSRVACSHDDALGVIVGSGRLEPELRECIKKLQLEDHVRLVGSRPHDQIPVWMNASDLFVLPSLNEGNPTVMFEALGCGKPFIGTRVGGVPDIINSDLCGLLAEPGDAEDLAEQMLAGLDREWDRDTILVYAGQYSWKAIAERIVNVYSEISRRPA